MQISDNDIPGGEFDYDLKIKLDGMNPAYAYKTPVRPVQPPKPAGPAVKKWQAFVVLFFGFICFGVGVSVGRGAPQERAYEPPSAPATATNSPVIVTETRTVPMVPGSCMLAFEKLVAMQSDLEIVIDSSKDQVQVSNRAYIAIVAKRVEDITKATAEQYDLNRKTSSAQLQLQLRLVELQNFLDQCKTDLGR